MKTPVLAIATLLLAAIPARAEDRIPLPPVTVIEPSPKPVAPSIGGTSGPNGTGANGGAPQHCADVPAGSDKSWACINQSLRRKVDEVNPTTNTPPIDAKSSDLKTGVVNIPGVQQQYGKNFGHSVVPYRPPPLIYSSPLGAHR